MTKRTGVYSSGAMDLYQSIRTGIPMSPMIIMEKKIVLAIIRTRRRSGMISDAGQRRDTLLAKKVSAIALRFLFKFRFLMP